MCQLIVPSEMLITKNDYETAVSLFNKCVYGVKSM